MQTKGRAMNTQHESDTNGCVHHCRKGRGERRRGERRKERRKKNFSQVEGSDLGVINLQGERTHFK